MKLFDRYCKYCDTKLGENDNLCQICGAQIRDESCYYKKFNYMPILKGLIVTFAVLLVLEFIFSFMPYKAYIAILVGTIYISRSYKRISPLSLATGGIVGLVVMVASMLFIFTNAINLIIGFILGVIGAALGGLLKMKSEKSQF